MSIFNFPSKRERIEGPTRLERTTVMLQELINSLRADGGGGVIGFTASTEILSSEQAEISVLGVTETRNTVGLGAAELQLICDELNAYLAADARPYTVTVHETPSSATRTFDDDFITNSTFTLRVTAQP